MDIEIVYKIILERINELQETLNMYDRANLDAPLDILARQAELHRLDTELRKAEGTYSS